MAPTASDVGGRFDVVLDDGNGHVNGFVTAKDDQSGLYYRPRRASYTSSPTFVERSNTQGNYGDNQQDFWLTFTQNDWSLGEQQRYFRSGDADKVRRYWSGRNIDVTTTPGQVSLYKTVGSTSVGSASGTTSVVLSTADRGGGAVWVGSDGHVYRGGTDLGLFPSSGTASCITVDSTAVSNTNSQVFVSNGSKIDRYDGSWHTSWSSSGVQRMTFLNNTLFGLGSSSTTTNLVRFSTAGVATTLFTWKGGSGTSPNGLIAPETNRLMYPFGGKMVLLIPNSGVGASLWIFDGTAPSKLMDFPVGFTATDLMVVNGIVYVSGMAGIGSGLNKDRAVIYYYANGSSGVLWLSGEVDNIQGCYMAAVNGDLVFAQGSFLYLYKTATGGVSKLSSALVATRLEQGYLQLLGVNYYALYSWSPGLSSIYSLYSLSSVATTGYVETSLFDGESSLDKYFKAVRVDWDAATDGNGGSVDVAYQLNSVDGSYTNVQTGAVAGTEYTIGQAGHSVSIKVTLNKGTSTLGPVLKRISVRAVPRLQAFRRREYVLELAGQNGRDPVQLRDGTAHNKDGMTMAQDLQSYYIGVLPITITDRFGTFTGYIEPDNTQIIEVKPEVFFAHLTVREV